MPAPARRARWVWERYPVPVTRYPGARRYPSPVTRYPSHSELDVKTLFVAAAAIFAAAPPATAQTLGIPVGSKAPVAAVETLDGKPASLAQYIGKAPVVMQFWATWCSNCKALEPRMAAARQKYAARGVRFVGLAVSVNQSPQRVRLYAQRHAPPLELFYDKTGAASDAYDAPATSYVVVVNRQGTVVYTGVGSDQNIDAAVRKAL